MHARAAFETRAGRARLVREVVWCGVVWCSEHAMRSYLLPTTGAGYMAA